MAERLTPQPDKDNDSLARTFLDFLLTEDYYQQLEGHTKVEIIQWLQDKGYVQGGTIDVPKRKK